MALIQNVKRTKCSIEYGNLANNFLPAVTRIDGMPQNKAFDNSKQSCSYVLKIKELEFVDTSKHIITAMTFCRELPMDYKVTQFLEVP